MHLAAAEALERAAAEHRRRAWQWECIGDDLRAVLEQQLAHNAAVLAAGELDMARRTIANDQSAEVPPEGFID
jgi:hypothetical protein